METLSLRDLVFILKALGSNGGFQARDKEAMGVLPKEWSFCRSEEHIGEEQWRM